jgi:hypothetical protein
VSALRCMPLLGRAEAQAHPISMTRQGSWVRESVFPSGSLNQAIFAPLGADQTPESSYSSHSYRSQLTPLPDNSLTLAPMSAPSQPGTV